MHCRYLDIWVLNNHDSNRNETASDHEERFAKGGWGEKYWSVAVCCCALIPVMLPSAPALHMLRSPSRLVPVG
ncbi:hypothetical protein GOODEAATRI_011539 [Goodea atripinnis]|uniref:Uncharacterized protein n=1 Tax=Goodea atripinnis TaxID=208336 RepID=A0ABV0PMR0_9TELE